MSKIIGYEILIGAKTTVEASVDNYIRSGWVPQGGIALSSSGNFAQAMIKFGKEDNKEYLKTRPHR